MQSLSKCTAAVLILGISMTLSAQESITYTDSGTAQTMNVEAKQFAPNYPDACQGKKAAEPVAAPAPKPVAPAPVAAAPDTDKDGVVDEKDKCPNTPHAYKVDPDGCPVHVSLHINFAFDSAVLPASSDKDVATLTRVLNENPQAKAIIVGHTDHTGSDEYNQKLSERRAHALGKKLIANGIDSGRIETAGKGEKEPVATNATAEGRAKNRRIDVELQ